MGHSGWVLKWVFAAFGLTAGGLAATPAAAEVDCFPHAAPALYSSAARPLAAILRPPIGGGAAQAAPLARPHHVTWRRPIARIIRHAHVGPARTPHRHVHVAATSPMAAPALGVDANAATAVPGLIRAAARPAACAPSLAAPPAVIAPPIVAALPPGGLAALPGLVTPPDIAPTGTGTDTATTTTDATDTSTVFPTLPGLPPEIVVVFPVTPPPGPVTSGGGVPEPATWMLMILGLGACGAALRSPRRA